MIDVHMLESKKKLTELADAVLLNSHDLELDTRFFAPLHQKMENFVLTDYLIELANERIEDLKVFINDETRIEVYKNQLIDFLRDLVRERL